jgi:hypothetical protein
MEKANPVYVRLEYTDSLQSEKDLLSSEIFFLNLINLRKKYNLLKLEEIIIKNKIKRAINKMELAVKKTQDSFPQVNLPKRRKTEKAVIGHEKADESLDSQLRDIQEKLKAFSAA